MSGGGLVFDSSPLKDDHLGLVARRAANAEAQE